MNPEQEYDQNTILILLDEFAKKFSLEEATDLIQIWINETPYIKGYCRT